MATHPSIEPGLKSGLKLVSGGPAAGSSEPFSTGRTQRRTLHRSMHRSMTRQQGQALEVIGHAVDYLNDSYLSEGVGDEILDFSGPTMEAVQLLISAQRQLLRSLPLTEPLTLRLWNRLLRRKSQPQPSAVVRSFSPR